MICYDISGVVNKKMTVCRFLLHLCRTIYPLPRFLFTCKLISFALAFLLTS